MQALQYTLEVFTFTPYVQKLRHHSGFGKLLLWVPLLNAPDLPIAQALWPAEFLRRFFGKLVLDSGGSSSAMWVFLAWF